MRPFCLCVAASVAMISAASTQTVQAQSRYYSQAPSSDWASKAIPVASRAHDFGTVARAANTEHRFMIKNVLEQELHISGVRASCGCTTPIVETETIKPGETGSILARFNTGTFTGQKQATLTVSIDRPFYTELQLNVRGYIRSDVVLSPGEIEFGQIPEGESKTLELNLEYAGRPDWKIERVESPVPFVDARFEEVSRTGGRIMYKISAVLADNAPVGFQQNQLILHTNDRRLTTVPIRFIADVQSPIQVSPQSFALGRVEAGEPIPQRLVVKSRKPFRILDITSESAEIVFEPIAEAKAAHLINISIAPNSTNVGGEVKGSVLLRTDLEEAPITLGLSYEMIGKAPVPSVAAQASSN